MDYCFFSGRVLGALELSAVDLAAPDPVNLRHESMRTSRLSYHHTTSLDYIKCRVVG